MDVTTDHLKFPPDYEEVRPKTDEPVPFEDSLKPKCPTCHGSWNFDESASTSISIVMHCAQPWVVVSCPLCPEKFLITASGKSSQVIDDGLSMHVSQFWIARLEA